LKRTEELEKQMKLQREEAEKELAITQEAFKYTIQNLYDSMVGHRDKMKN